MSNVDHNTLTGTDLHENKGVAAATNSTVATASAGATVWKLLDNSNLAALGNPFANMAHFREEQSSGTTTSSSPSGSSFTTLTLNTTKVNNISGASLATNLISLPAGTYIALAIFPWASAGNPAASVCKLKLRDTTNSVDLLIGTNGEQGSQNVVQQSYLSICFGQFTISGTVSAALQARCSNYTKIGGASFGVVEVYAEILLWKIS